MDVLHIEWLLYYCKCSYSGLELHARYNWQVKAPNTHSSLFLIRQFVRTYTSNSKTAGRTWKFCISNNCSTIRHSFYGLDLHERSNWRAMTPYTHHSHFQIQHCACTANIRRNIGHLEFYYTPINSTATQNDSSCIKSSKALPVSQLWSCTYITIWCATMHDDKTHWAYSYTTH